MAGAKVLKTYQQKHNLKTIEQIVSRYAEGNREAYAKYLAKHIGVNVDDEIKVQEHMPMLIKAMVMFECGQQPFHEATFALLGTSTNM